MYVSLIRCVKNQHATQYTYCAFKLRSVTMCCNYFFHKIMDVKINVVNKYHPKSSVQNIAFQYFPNHLLLINKALNNI